MQEVQRQAYTSEEVAKMFGVGRSTVYKWVREGVLPKVPIDMDRILIPAWAVDQLIEATKPKDKKSSKVV
jgi:DNA binding domain, excisionase family